jgi:hypothetical protein
VPEVHCPKYPSAAPTAAPMRMGRMKRVMI